MALAEHTARALDASGAQVVVLARAGQDLHEVRLRWSHLGLAYRDGTRWRVVHKLNQCGTAQAAVYRQGLGEFFLDDLYRVQGRHRRPRAGGAGATARQRCATTAASTRLNTPAYSMVAYPWSQTYQQSNQWALETLAMTQDPAATSRERAQAWLKLQGLRADHAAHLNAFKRLGARVPPRPTSPSTTTRTRNDSRTASRPSPSTRCSRG